MTANVSPGGGLIPVRMLDGSPYNASGATPMYCASGGVAVGDPVIISGTANSAAITNDTGYVLGASEMPAGTLEAVVKATNGATNRTTGVVVGVCPNPTTTMTGLPNVLPSGSAGILQVDRRENVMYSLASDGVGGTHTVADIGSNANLTGSTYDTTSGESNVRLSHTTVAADATYQLKIHRLSGVPKQGNLANDGVVFYVTLNLPTDANNQAGV